MNEGISFAFALFVGFGHAFEADHILAVSSLVSKSDSIKKAVVEGFIWGLGHTAMILLIGLLVISFKFEALEGYFDYFEIFVGIMLIVLGIMRLIHRGQTASGAHNHKHERQAFGVGLVHGLAGSGALILLVMAELPGPWQAIGYLFLGWVQP
jgi:hypothetical protein